MIIITILYLNGFVMIVLVGAIGKKGGREMVKRFCRGHLGKGCEKCEHHGIHEETPKCNNVHDACGKCDVWPEVG